MPFQYASGIDVNTDNLSSQSGLDGVPAVLVYLCKEVGLIGKPWTSLGDQWQGVCKLWLCAETLLEGSTHSNLSFTQISKSAIPEDWKDWMHLKLMNSDVRPPVDSFGNMFTDYFKGL